MSFDVKYMNPFIKGATDVVEQVCNIKLQTGKPFIKNGDGDDNTIAIMIGMTGQVQGQVLITMKNKDALKIASLMMMGMPVLELDNMAVSAISELGNMIMGTTSTIFSNNGISTDITPPMIFKGKMSIKQTFGTTISIPLISDIISITLDITLKNN